MSTDKEYIHIEELLDEGLKQESEFFLPDNFADKMMFLVEKRNAWINYFKEFLIYFGALAGILSTVLAIIFFFNTESWKVLVEVFLSNMNMVLGVGIILLFILFVDKVILQFFFYKAEIQK